MSRTTIALSKSTRDRLFEYKRPGDSYEDVVDRLIETAGEPWRGGTEP